MTVCLPLSFVPISLYVPEALCRTRPGSWDAALGFLTAQIQTLYPQQHPGKKHHFVHVLIVLKGRNVICGINAEASH